MNNSYAKFVKILDIGKEFPLNKINDKGNAEIHQDLLAMAYIIQPTGSSPIPFLKKVNSISSRGLRIENYDLILWWVWEFKKF